ncbi:hypothetical protein GGS23DRAFT_617322 [Durotheca rogersii]|uniref:uncharacterized protein n=1 Tax=Durotheca rogersii TaxID=419775 RepID=UPI00221E82CE|nr:uncharacterized protein GGS23DRAFT_617322 [Durotheca rogersii]KAI5866232.1 hypothetical protein GGS23DRAFT_617322 [Durotheca rogersii]
MPQDPNLYGQRPPKRQKKEVPLSSSVAFTSQLTSLISSATAPVASGRARPSKTKDDIFSVKAKRKAPGGDGGRDRNKDGSRERGSNTAKISLKDPRGTEEEKQDLARTRRRMEEKARLYAAMKRGDYVAREGEAAPLVDFDRKWAEKHPEGDGSDSSSSGGSGTDGEGEGNDDDEMVEYTDEFGRTRRVSRAEARRERRRAARRALGAAELEAMAGRPRAPEPERLLRGDVVQTAAFAPDAAARAGMAALAARRDRTPTPPPDAHFDGRAEIRTKGVGFYHFRADDAAARAAQMADLARERAATERARAERRGGAAATAAAAADDDDDDVPGPRPDPRREERRRVLEERRRRMGEKRAERLAESFLDGLAGEIGASGGALAGGGGGNKGEEKGEAAGSDREEKRESAEDQGRA